MDRDDRQPRVARLLQSFDQQRPVGLRREDVRVEVVALDLLGVGQDDLSDAERRDLRPQPAHHFRPRHSQQEIDRRPRRDARSRARSASVDRAVRDRLHRADATRPVDDADADRVSWRDVQHVQQVSGPRARQRQLAGRADLARLEQDQVHVGRRYPEATSPPYASGDGNAPAAALWISAHSRLSTSACRLASMMFSLTPIVPHSVTPSLDSISTRVVAAVPVVESMMRTL